MATTYHNAIQQLYVAYFNRPADPAGLDFWETVMEGNGGDSAVISAEFAKSGEYTTEYDQLTTSGVVSQVYQNLFGHAPDSAGLAFWVNALNNRAMTVDTMVTEIARGAQGTDRVAFDSKVTVATAFTYALDTEAEIAGYNNADALSAAKELLSTITTAADATAAIVPATLDASVAAVVKAGTPFGLESGLAALGAANAAVADYLETYGEEHDITDADSDDVEAAVDAAEADLVDLIADPGFADASEGVQAALIADQVAANAAALETAQDNLTAAQEAVEEVDGLGEAIATVTSAEQAAEEAAEVAELALQDYLIAYDTFRIRNEGADFSSEERVTVEVDGEDVVVAELVGGALVIPEDIDAADFPGLTEFVNAGNAAQAAAADVEAATDAVLVAQMEVELLENPTVSTEDQFTFTLTSQDVTEPTADQILDELSALSAAGDEEAYEAFRQQVRDFNAANQTPLADAVLAAEQGGLARAQAAVDAVTGLGEAVALLAAQSDLADAEGELDTDLRVVGDRVVLASDEAVAVAELDEDGNMVLVDDADADTYTGLNAYIAAYNAETAAEAAFNETGVSVSASDLADANADLVEELETQQGYVATVPAASDETAYANYVAALGVEGTQDAVDALSDALAALEEAQADAAELTSLQDAVDDAIADFEANDYNAPVMLGANAFGTSGSDIFITVEDQNSTITNFGRSGDDVLYVGEGYTLNTSDDLDDGVDAVLEVFFTQQGNNTIVTVETEAYGSDSGDVQTITLTGVSAEDLTFTNGIITV